MTAFGMRYNVKIWLMNVRKQYEAVKDQPFMRGIVINKAAAVEMKTISSPALG